MSVHFPGEQILSLVYVSSAVKLFSEEALIDLLRRARENNERVGVTGMLLYEDGGFMQALEGPESAVRDTFQRIERDPRHKSIQKLIEQRLPEREFGGWTMGFRNVSHATWDEENGGQPSGAAARLDAELQRARTNAGKLMRNFRSRMRTSF